MLSNGSRRVITVVVIAAMLSPAIRNHDSLPLSTYPMYAGNRSSVSRYVTAVGVTEAGEPQTLSTTTIASTMDWLIAQSFLNDAVRRGDAEPLCSEIAGRAPSQLSSIEIATERHNTIAYVQDRPSLIGRTVHATCEVAP